MAITLLIPTPIAERCYLWEALLWVAVRRFPLSAKRRYYEAIDIDDREDTDTWAINARPRYPHGVTITDEECDRAKLPRDPEHEALKEGKEYTHPEVIKRLLTNPFPEDGRRHFEDLLLESENFHNRKAEWDLQFNKFLVHPKAKLLGALHEGRLKAFGIALPARILLQIHPPAIIWSRDSPGIPVHPNWEAISPEIWTPEAVHWEYGSVEWGYTDYCLVLVDTADLMELFPPPAPEQFEGAVRIASTLALKDTTGTGDSAVQRRVGRRPYHWEVILAEAQRFVHANGLPAKQDAFVLIMCNWCEKNL
jgi:hypothetical protein